MPDDNSVSVERILQLALPADLRPALPVLRDAAGMVLNSPERFEQASQSINEELSKQERVARSPWLGKMLNQSVAEPPTLGAGHDIQVNRMILLSALATYPGDMSRFGLCGQIPWDTLFEKVDPPHGGTFDSVPVFGREHILFNLKDELHAGMIDVTKELAAKLELILRERSETKAAGAPGADAKPGETLTESELKVLKRIAESNVLLKGPDAYADVAERTGKLALTRLEKIGLIDRPQGERKGYAITSKGKIARTESAL